MRIAITGHRPNRMHVGERRVAMQIGDVLNAVARTARGMSPPRPPLAISALAEGSDRLFASAALRLGMPLRVVLPFASAHYETTFGDATTTSVYRALLAQAEQVIEMPGRLSDSTSAYEAVGRASVDGCDLLLAVWDGKPAVGLGGTPEIIQYARDRRCPAIWIDAASKRRPLLLENTGPMVPTKLDQMPLDAKPVTSRQLRALVARKPRSS